MSSNCSCCDDYTDLGIVNETTNEFSFEEKENDPWIDMEQPVKVLVKELSSLGDDGGLILFTKKLYYLNFDPSNPKSESRFYSSHKKSFYDYMVERMKNFSQFENYNFKFHELKVHNVKSNVSNIQFEKDYFVVDGENLDYPSELRIELLVSCTSS